MDNQQPRLKYKNAQKYFIEKNVLYGNYLAIEEIEKYMPNKHCVCIEWKVKHIIINKERIMRAARLIQIDKKYKEKLKSGNYQNGLIKYLYNRYKSGAFHRKHEFLLSLDEFKKLIFNNCYYCGCSPKISSNNIIIGRGNISEPPLYYNGIDRLDSLKDYSTDNCVSCCSTCNYMKHTLTVSEFIKHINKIFIYFKQGSTTISNESTIQANGIGNGSYLTNNVEDKDIV